MRLRSIGRKLSYVLVGALGTYVVERVPDAPPPRYINVDVPAPEEPSRAAFLHQIAHPPRPSVEPRRLLAAFDGSGTSDTAVRCADDGFDVVELGPNYRAVHRAFLDCMLEDQAQLMRHSRIIPVMQDGRTTGIKLFGVRVGDALWKLGFRNGDELRDLNEMDVTNPDHALSAYARLRDNPNVSAGIVRAGAPLRLRFVIC